VLSFTEIIIQPEDKECKQIVPYYLLLLVSRSNCWEFSMAGAELRIIAELANATSWINAFNKGWDVHSVCSTRCLCAPPAGMIYLHASDRSGTIPDRTYTAETLGKFLGLPVMTNEVYNPRQQSLAKSTPTPDLLFNLASV